MHVTVQFHQRWSTFLLVLIVILAPLLLPRPIAHAALPIVVTTTLDTNDGTDGRCSLREAITAANTNIASSSKRGECSAGDSDTTIVMTGVVGVINLSGPLPALTRNMRFMGPGADRLTISGVNQYRVFFVSGATVSITGLTIANGLGQGKNGGSGKDGGGGGGGGAGMGGGMVVDGGNVTLEGVTFHNNRAVGGAGGNGSIRTNNSPGSHGGGGGGGGGDGTNGSDGNPDTGIRNNGGRGGDGGDFGGYGGSGNSQPGDSGGDGAGGAGGGCNVDIGGAGGTGGFGGGAGGGGGGDIVGGAGGTGFEGGGGGGGGSRRDPGPVSPSPGGGSISVGGSFSGGTGANGSVGTGVDGIVNTGGSGGGGGGLGGALFARAGRVVLIDTTFRLNQAIPGVSGLPANTVNGTGKGYGGAIAIRTDARVISTGTLPQFIDNHAQNAGDPSSVTNDNNLYGNIIIIPSVTITDAGDLSSRSPTSSSFTITRSDDPADPNDLASPLTVGFTVGGSAIYNQHYRVSGADTFNTTRGSVTIPAGATSATITVALREDSNAGVGRGKSILLTLDTSDGYVVADPGRATIGIDANSPAWLVMLYIAADDRPPTDPRLQSLHGAATELLHNLRFQLPPNPALQLVVLFDGTGQGDSQIFASKRYQAGMALQDSTMLEAIEPGASIDNELDTGSATTLAGFIRWARRTYSADHTMLSVIDHGGGWAPDFGAIGQPSSRGSTQAGGWRGMSLDASANSSMSTRQTGELFAGLDTFGHVDVLFFDACLMGMIESAHEVQRYSDYFIAGQNLLWAEFPYTSYFTTDVLTYTTTPLSLTRTIIERYNQGSSTPPNPYTIAALDMRKLPDLRAEVNTLAEHLLNALPGGTNVVLDAKGKIHAAYTATQKFDYDTSLSIEQDTEGFVDLAHFAINIKQQFASSPEISAAAQSIIDHIKPCAPNGPTFSCTSDGAVVALKRINGLPDTLWNWNFDKAQGVSIYLPLGEEDCRPTGDPTLRGQPGRACKGREQTTIVEVDAEQIAEENQLFYYTSEQLTFVRDAPQWAKLLQQLQQGVPPLAPGRQFNSPYPLPDPLPEARPRIFLPLVQHGPTFVADLEITAITVSPANPQVGQPVEVRVTIRNSGTADITTPFWVDLYIDPTIEPVPNVIWPDVSQYGAAWRVPLLAAGEERTFSTNDPSDPGGRYSNFTTFVASGRHRLVALADSFEVGQPNGTVREANEGNNRSAPLEVSVVGAAPTGASPSNAVAQRER